jgi:hypothetical protein
LDDDVDDDGGGCGEGNMMTLIILLVMVVMVGMSMVTMITMMVMVVMITMAMTMVMMWFLLRFSHPLHKRANPPTDAKCKNKQHIR